MPVPSAAPAERRRPPGRYDEPSLLTQRVVAVVLGLAFVGLLVAIAAAFYERLQGDRLTVRQLGFSVQSDRAVRVDFEVVAPVGSRPYCLVRARGETGVEVGSQVLPFGPVREGERSLRASHVLPTSERAVTGEVPLCRLEPPSEPRPSP